MQQQLGGKSKKMWEKQPWRYQSQYRRRTGGVPGTEQQFSEAQERPHSGAGCLPAAHGHSWSRSLCAAGGGAHVQQWMWPEGGYNPWRTSTKTGYWPEKQLMVGNPQWSCCHRDLYRSSFQRMASYGGTPHNGAGAERDCKGTAEMKWHGLTPFPHSGERSVREWI